MARHTFYTISALLFSTIATAALDPPSVRDVVYARAHPPATVTTTLTLATTTTTVSAKCTTTSRPCPGGATETLQFDKDLTSDYISPFPLEYHGMTFSGSAGWISFNTTSTRYDFLPPDAKERNAAKSPPMTLCSLSYGMVGFGTMNQAYTFDLGPFYLFAWAPTSADQPQDPDVLWLTIRTDKMGTGGAGSFPYAIPVPNGGDAPTLIDLSKKLGDLTKGLKEVELAVWQSWDWNRDGVEGNPATGFTIDNLVVTKKRC